MAAVKTHSGNAKTIFADAVRRELMERSPFAQLKSGVTPTRNTRYVTPEETVRILDACPDAEWRLLIGLARLAGLRTPSETHLLTWADVHWDQARLHVRSPKTERHQGHEKRIVPICPRLMELLQDRFEVAEEGEEGLITIRGGGAIRRRILAIVERAGVEMWKDTWQTLRRSCEIEWAQSYPQYAVSRWIGHSITVSGRHYANAIPDELFEKVAVPRNGTGPANRSKKQAAQKAAQHAAESSRNGSHGAPATKGDDSANSRRRKALRDDASRCENRGKWSRGESNPRPDCAGQDASTCVSIDLISASGPPMAAFPLAQPTVFSRPPRPKASREEPA